MSNVAPQTFEWPPRAEKIEVVALDASSSRVQDAPKPRDASLPARGPAPTPARARSEHARRTKASGRTLMVAAAVFVFAALAVFIQFRVVDPWRRAAPLQTSMAPAKPVQRPLGGAAESHAAVAAAGTLSVRGPSGSRVWVDGQPKGPVPVSLGGVPGGRHRVNIKTDSWSVEETVEVSPGSGVVFVASSPQQAAAKTSSPSATARTRTPQPGSVVMALPFQVQIYEDGRFVGTNRTEVSLPAGRHRLELVNKALNYDAVEPVQIESGKTTRISATLPLGSASLNASPWAEVFVDGRSVGQTPLASVPIPIGIHEVVFRHPQFGEQSRTVMVAAGVPVKVGVDLRK